MLGLRSPTAFACRQCREEARLTRHLLEPKLPNAAVTGNVSQISDTIRRQVRRGFHASKPSHSYSSRGKYRPPGALAGYFADLTAPRRSKAQPKSDPVTPTPPLVPPTYQYAAPVHQTPQERARVVFGSRLAGPAERRRELDASSTRIAGILVPPRPLEPDNCCMSGCVNCVWDRYREELEEWADASREVEKRLAGNSEKRTGLRGLMAGMGAETGGRAEPEPNVSPAVSMDDDGGGSQTNWNLGPPRPMRPASPSAGDAGGNLFADVPVGIREFMRIEKRLKEKHKKKTAAATA